MSGYATADIIRREGSGADLLNLLHVHLPLNTEHTTRDHGHYALSRVSLPD
jgi:hypothetical protein